MPRFSSTQLRQARVRKGWSREELALAVGRGFQSVSLWERGAVIPPPSIQLRIASTLGISLEDLFDPGIEVG
jgi:transcriptional regulator with XRE-family HTH domain